jgi:hypothetical protein
MTALRFGVALAITIGFFDVDISQVTASTIEWITFDPNTHTQYHAVSSSNRGGVYVAGYTSSTLSGSPVISENAFLKRFDSDGNTIWTRQIGTPETDSAYGVAADGFGNIYLAGDTYGNLGSSNIGNGDAFVSKFHENGNLIWTKQIGSTGSDVGTRVAADRLGNVYIAGYTDGDLGEVNAGGIDTFLAKFDGEGNNLWTRQLGTISPDATDDLCVDGLGNVYVAGNTGGSLGGASAGGLDALLSKYDSDGNHLWSRQLGSTEWDYAIGVSADLIGNVFITGITYGGLDGPNLGKIDGFVSKYDSDGSFEWVRQVGSTQHDTALGVAVDGLGNVVFTGYTYGDLGGGPSGREDTYVTMYDSLGNSLWMQRFDLDQANGSGGLSADGNGNIYVTGGVANSRGFLTKLHSPIQVPEPSGPYNMCLLGGLALCTRLSFNTTNSRRKIRK